MFGFLAQLLSWCYQVWPNYAAMILLFTLIVMVVVTPFTIKGMRSAAEMARIQPEMKKLQDQYKNDRVKQNEEMQALFKEHGVNPLGGCLPTLLPLPIFFIIFRLLERMNARHTGAFAPLVRLLRHNVGGPAGFVDPHYLAYKATLTQAIIHSNGKLNAFGFDLAATARQHHSSTAAAIPYFALIAIMTGSQYWQQRQINQRNPAAANANPQMKMTMQLFPAFYAIISLNIPAAVVLYLLLSGLFRMAQNAISYRYDPVLVRAAVPPEGAIDAASRPKAGVGANGAKAAITSGAPARGKPGSGRVTPPASSPGRSPGRPAPTPKGGGGFMERLRAQAAEAKAQAEQARSAGNGKPGGSDRPVKREADGRGKTAPVPPPDATVPSSATGNGLDQPEPGAPEATEDDRVAGMAEDAAAPRPAPDDDRSARPSPLSVRPSGRRPKKGR
ncbi:MAG TPA: membrane protein insertase YidC [Acidimicrobiales bacterium]